MHVPLATQICFLWDIPLPLHLVPPYAIKSQQPSATQSCFRCLIFQHQLMSLHAACRYGACREYYVQPRSTCSNAMSKATGIFIKLSCSTQVQYLSATCCCSAQELYFTPAPLSLILHMSQRRVMCLPAFVYNVVLTANSAYRPFRSLLMCLYSGHKLEKASWPDP